METLEVRAMSGFPITVHKLSGAELGDNSRLIIPEKELRIGSSTVTVEEIIRQTAINYFLLWKTQYLAELRSDIQAAETAAGDSPNKIKPEEIISGPSDIEEYINDIMSQFKSRISMYPKGQLFRVIENTDVVRKSLEDIFEKDNFGLSGQQIEEVLKHKVLVGGAISSFRTNLDRILYDETWAEATDRGTLKSAHIPDGTIGVCPAVTAPNFIRKIVGGMGSGCVEDALKLGFEEKLDGIAPFSKFSKYSVFLEGIESGKYSVARDTEGRYYVVENRLRDIGNLTHITGRELDLVKKPENYLFLFSYERSDTANGKLMFYDPNMQLHVGRGAKLVQLKPNARHDPASLNYCVLLAYIINQNSEIAKLVERVPQTVETKAA